MSTSTRREFLAATAVAVAATSLRAEASTLRLATFQTEVTPPVGHPCMGGGIAPVKEVIDPLYVHGSIFLGLDKPVAIVTVDWCEIRNDAYDRWREAIATAIGTTRERVLLNANHQHDAPISDLYAEKLLRDAKAEGSICDLEFHEKTVTRVAAVAKAALAKSQPITHFGYGKAKVDRVGSNRRYLDEKGNVQYDRYSANRDPKIRDAEEGLIDPFLHCLAFWNEATLLAAISTYSTHPMSFYGRGAVSADFVGLARRMRQADEPNALQMYASGCSGNVTAGKYNDGTAENRPELAKRIHAAMKAAYANAKKQPIGKCEFRSTPLMLPVRTQAEFDVAAMQKKIRESKRPFDQCLAAMGLSWRARCERKQPIDVATLDFGGASYLLLPAESYVEFQLYAQTIRPNDGVLVAGYGESAPGYIPIERAWKESDSNLRDWCWVDPGSEQIMKDAIRKALQASPK
jgi:hypothetical protein